MVDGIVRRPNPEAACGLEQFEVSEASCFGVLAKEIRDKLAKHAQQSTRKYTNGRGKRAFVGTKFLKNTQILILSVTFRRDWGTSFAVTA